MEKLPDYVPAKALEQITRNELIGISIEWGIKNPSQKTNGMLQKEIWESQLIQFMFENNGDVPDEFEIDSRRTYQIKWIDGIELRKMGLDFNTLILLLVKGFKSLDQFTTYTKNQLEDDIGLPSAFATLLANRFSTMEKSSMMERLEKMNQSTSRESQLNFAHQQVLQRINRKKWPNNEKQSFVNFIRSLEYDLRTLDPTKQSWIEHITVLLENEKEQKI